ncbi:MAG TPA: tetratricopeptide repeat protein, partial [Gammaproteobacteria bacterium]|nr:tetratricopeptide repeat protein [Gammaproteobacteria bacterium]
MNEMISETMSSQILSLLKRGDIETAEKRASELRIHDSESFETQYVSGLVYLLKGDFLASVPYLKNAQIKQPKHAAINCNLGVAYHRVGMLDQAFTCLGTALELNKEYVEARYNLGCVLLDMKKSEEAFNQFSILVGQFPTNADYVCAKADAVRDMKKWSRSVALYQQAIQLDANCARAHINISPILHHLGRLDEAVVHGKKAVELSPSRASSHKYLGDALAAVEQLDEAMDAYANAYELDDKWAELCVSIADVWFDTGNYIEAKGWYEKTLQLDTGNVRAECGLAKIIKELGDSAQACERFKALTEVAADDVIVRVAYADAMWDDGDAVGAIEQIRIAQKLQPERVGLYAKAGQILSSSGEVDAALKEYMVALEQNPVCVPALSGLATTMRGKLGDEYVHGMENLINSKQCKSGRLGSLYSGLSYYYDGIKDFKKAAEYIQLGNQNNWESNSKRGWEYDVDKHEKYITSLIEAFDSSYFESVRGLGVDDKSPTFIVAMPRSGTTLTEQILARHPQVLGIGERNYALQSFNSLLAKLAGNEIKEKLARLKTDDVRWMANAYINVLSDVRARSAKPESIRIVDKMPDNYCVIGWILTMFP